MEIITMTSIYISAEELYSFAYTVTWISKVKPKIFVFFNVFFFFFKYALSFHKMYKELECVFYRDLAYGSDLL